MIRSLLSCVWFVAALMFCAAAHAAEPGNGDLSGDSLLTTVDVNLLRDHLLAKNVLSGSALFVADVNTDTLVNVADSVTMLKRLNSKKILIDVTPSSGSWTLQGPSGFATLDGVGDRMGKSAISNSIPGAYRLHCKPLAGLLAPADTTATLATNGTLVFTPTYCGVNSISINPANPATVTTNATVTTSGTLTGMGSGTIEYHWITQKPNGTSADSGALTVAMVNGRAIIPPYNGFPTDSSGNYQARVRVTRPALMESTATLYSVLPAPAVSSVDIGDFIPDTVRLNGKISLGGTIKGSGWGKIQYRWFRIKSTEWSWTNCGTFETTMVNGTATIPAYDLFKTDAYGYYSAYVEVLRPGSTSIKSGSASYMVADATTVTFAGLGRSTDTLQNDHIPLRAGSKVTGVGTGNITYHFITQKPDGTYFDGGPLNTLMENGKAEILNYYYPAMFPTDQTGTYHSFIRVTNPEPALESNVMDYTVLPVANVTTVTLGEFTPSVRYNYKTYVQQNSVVSHAVTLRGTGSGWVEYDWYMVKADGSDASSSGRKRAYMQDGIAVVSYSGLPTNLNGAELTSYRYVSFWLRFPSKDSFFTTYWVEKPMVIESVSLGSMNPATAQQHAGLLSPYGIIKASSVWNADYHWIVEKPDGSTHDSGAITAVVPGDYTVPKYALPTDLVGTYQVYLKVTSPEPAKESAKVSYTVTPPPIAEIISVSPFTPSVCYQDGRVYTTATLVGSGTGPVTYRWLTRQPDGKTSDSGALTTQMVNGSASVPIYVGCPTKLVGDYSTVLRVTSQTPFKDSAPTSYTVASTTRIVTLNDGVTTMALVRVPTGSFQMGSSYADPNYASHEGPIHTVTLANPFWIGKFEVTQAQWVAVMGNNPAAGVGIGIGNNYPVCNVSWNDIAAANGFVDKLNEWLKASSQGVQARLPSEAEWEYACRAGTTTRFYFGEAPNNTFTPDSSTASTIYPGKRGDYMWFSYNCSGNNYGDLGMKPVGTKIPNAWGLYDMAGNVFEFCQDSFHYGYIGAPADGSAWMNGGYQSSVFRGGSWESSGLDGRSAARNGKGYAVRDRNTGFRIVMTTASTE